MSSVELPKSPSQDYLTDDERAFLRRMLSDPAEFPTQLGDWMQEYVAVHGEFTLAQVKSQSQFLPNVSIVAESQSGAPAQPNYGDLTTVGPQLTNLAAGKYLCIYGWQASTPLSALQKVRLSLNGVGDDLSRTTVTKFNPALTEPVFAQRAYIIDAPLPSNDVKMEYQDFFLDGAYFSTRFLVGLRLS